MTPTKEEKGQPDGRHSTLAHEGWTDHRADKRRFRQTHHSRK